MQPLLEMQAGIELPSSAQGRGRCSVRAIPSSERVRVPRGLLYPGQGKVILAPHQPTANCKQSCERRSGRIDPAYTLWRIESVIEQGVH
jgi:hypothetical protein